METLQATVALRPNALELEPAAKPSPCVTAPARARHRADIDGLRAVAILPVLAFHALPQIASGGFVGVDVFFVISGYLITGIILSGTGNAGFGFAGFYARRVRRIFPSLSVVLAATIAAGWFLLLPDAYSALGGHVAAGAGFVANLLSWKEAGYFDTASTTKPLLHLWSLGVEEQFYIAWPLLLYALRRRPSARHWVMLALASGSFVLNVHLARVDAAADFYSPLTRFWELLLGGMLADAGFVRWVGSTRAATAEVSFGPHPGSGASPRMANVLGALGLALIGCAVFVVDASRPFPGAWALLPSFGAVLAIAAGPSAWTNRHLLSNRPMVGIGLISFQLYLWHWPLLVFVRAIVGGEPSIAVRLTMIAVSFPLAWLTYVLIDLPVRTGSRARAKTAAACCVLAALGLVGLGLAAAHGVPTRFPAAVRGLAGFHYAYATAYREGSCFLRPEQDAAQLSMCTDTGAPPGARSIFLWGDSHAAHLYPGLAAAERGRTRLTQQTASACPPLLDVEFASRPHCAAINRRVMQRIGAEHPDEVILAARWELYDWRKVSATIARLHEVGVPGIFVIGPVPVWRGGLPLSAYCQSARDGSHGVPQRMQGPLDPGAGTLDREMAAFLTGGPAQYVSPMRILCDGDGCLVRTGPGIDSLTAWDDAHLTTAGSQFLVSHFPEAAIAGNH